MSQITPIQIIREQLALQEHPGPARRKKRAWFGGSISAAILPAVLVALFGVSTNAIGALLTATSIMTGLIFTMAMRFWERSLDARSDPAILFDEDRRAIIDHMKTLLLWTVFAGILSTAWLAGLALVIGSGHAPVWATAVSSALVAYQLIYVGRALASLYSASITLRP